MIYWDKLLKVSKYLILRWSCLIKIPVRYDTFSRHELIRSNYLFTLVVGEFLRLNQPTNQPTKNTLTLHSTLTLTLKSNHVCKLFQLSVFLFSELLSESWQQCEISKRGLNSSELTDQITVKICSFCEYVWVYICMRVGVYVCVCICVCFLVYVWINMYWGHINMYKLHC